MSLQTKIWVQIAGAGLLLLLALAQSTGLMQPTFDTLVWTVVLALGAVYMLFEAWRTRRKAGAETNKTVEKS